MKFAWIAILLINLQCILGQRYIAGVVDYAPKRNSKHYPKNIIEDNLNDIKSIVEKLKTKVDIMVFPEYCLTTKEPKYKITDHLKSYSMQLPSVSQSSQNFTDKVLTSLSSIAKSKNIYLVVNVIEDDDNMFYSTTIVFDRTGSLIAKYRKINVVDEQSLSAGNEMVVFDTDFKVRIGLLTSHDILFTKPLKQLTDENVDNIIVPMLWTSDVPFIYVESILDGLKKANGVNTLIASYVESSLDDKTKIRIVNVDSNKNAKGKENRVFASKFTTPEIRNLPKFVVKSLPNDSAEVCESQCCVTYKTAKASTNLNEYKMLSFNGEQELFNKTISISFCGLMFMSAWDRSQPKSRQTDFESISVTAKYPCNELEVHVPVTLSDDNSTSYTYTQSCDKDPITIKIEKCNSKLTTFGIFGRLYENGETSQASAGTSDNFKIILFLCTFYMLYVGY